MTGKVCIFHLFLQKLIGTSDGSTTRFIPTIRTTLRRLMSCKVSRVDFVDRELENGSRGKALFVHLSIGMITNIPRVKRYADTSGHYRFKGQ